MPQLHRRALISDVVERRAASALAAPYMTNVNKWQVQLTRLRAVKFSGRSTEDERIQAQLQLGELLEAVQHHRVEFSLAMKGHPMTGALVDLEKSLRRLTNELRIELLS